MGHLYQSPTTSRGLLSVFHFHVHVVPRYRPDELQLMWQEAPADDADLAAVRARVLASDH
jgi:diadenosine tetraphosphate (Ap4A) HIT family hydrolase